MQPKYTYTTTYNLLKNKVYAQQIKPINKNNVTKINTYLLSPNVQPTAGDGCSTQP
jgi:hypothetical protein